MTSRLRMAGGPTHGFVDESIRAGSYRLTLVVARPVDLASLARDLRRVVPKGSRRTHMSDEGSANRREILRVVARLPVLAIVYRTNHRRTDNDEPARRRCLEAMLPDLRSLRVGALVFDTRGPSRDDKDRETIRRAISQGVAAPTLNYAHRGSRDELLLGLPDAIGWAAGAGSHSALLVAGITRLIDVP